MRTRTLSLLVTPILLLASCGGRADVFADDPRHGSQSRGITLPEPIPAAPVYAISTAKPLNDRALEALEGVEGVAVIAPVGLTRLRTKGELGKITLRVGLVEPLVFRSVAPAATRDAEFVWVSMIVGQAVPTFDAARRLGLSGAGQVQIGGTTFQVGAFADNGVPNIADVLIQDGADRKLDIPPATTFIVGAESGVTVETLGEDIKQLMPGARLRRLIPQATVPAQQQPQGAPQPVGHVEGGVIGSMTFEILPNGFIRPDPSWVAANIVTAQVPILGSVQCHRLMIPRLSGALEDVAEAGLAKLIRPDDYGGCFVPRFIDRDPGKPLSNHAFGLAVDLNVSTNGLGTRGNMDPRIIEIFRRWGFNWGGYWSRPDPMHFELAG